MRIARPPNCDLLHESSFSKVWSDIRAKASQQAETVAKLAGFTKFLTSRPLRSKRKKPIFSNFRKSPRVW